MEELITSGFLFFSFLYGLNGKSIQQKRRQTNCWINFIWMIFTLERFSFRAAIFQCVFIVSAFFGSILFCSILLWLFSFFLFCLHNFHIDANGLRTKSQFTQVVACFFPSTHKTNFFCLCNFVFVVVFLDNVLHGIHFIDCSCGEKEKN